MHCLNCKSSNLYSSSNLAAEERTGLLKDVTCFVLCKGCGNVMLKNENNELLSTDDIKDTKVIGLAYQKLFNSSSFSGTAPTQYGFTKTGSKQSVSNLPKTNVVESKPSVETPPAIQAPASKPETKVVEPKTYPHVDNKEPKLTIFGKLAKFVDKVLDKIFNKAS